jgi:hypothetical protein
MTVPPLDTVTAQPEICSDRCFNVTCGACRLIECVICLHTYGEHYTTNDGSSDGCSMCTACEGFCDPVNFS